MASGPGHGQDARGWLAVSGPDPIESLSTRQLNRAVRARLPRWRPASTSACRCTRFGTVSLRTCSTKVDIRVIQVLLGHKKIKPTVLYTQVATDLLREVISPLERLPTA